MEKREQCRSLGAGYAQPRAGLGPRQSSSVWHRGGAQREAQGRVGAHHDHLLWVPVGQAPL